MMPWKVFKITVSVVLSEGKLCSKHGPKDSSHRPSFHSTLSTDHKATHTLLLNAFLLFLLLALGVGMVHHHGFVQLANLALDVAVELLELFSMLQHTVQVLLVHTKCTSHTDIKGYPTAFHP